MKFIHTQDAIDTENNNMVGRFSAKQRKCMKFDAILCNVCCCCCNFVFISFVVFGSFSGQLSIIYVRVHFTLSHLSKVK